MRNTSGVKPTNQIFGLIGFHCISFLLMTLNLIIIIINHNHHHHQKPSLSSHSFSSVSNWPLMRMLMVTSLTLVGGSLPVSCCRCSFICLSRAWNTNSWSLRSDHTLKRTETSSVQKVLKTYPDVSLHLPHDGALLVSVFDVGVNRNIVHSGASDHVGQRRRIF